MERIKYYSSNDFSFSEEFNRALSLIKNIKEKECNINDILEFYNNYYNHLENHLLFSF